MNLDLTLELRNRKKLHFGATRASRHCLGGKGDPRNRNKKRKSLRVLLLEDEESEDDEKLRQVLAQLKDFGGIRLRHSRFSEALETLKGNEHNFVGVVVVAAIPTSRTRKVIEEVKKAAGENLSVRQLPVAVLSGKDVCELS